MTHSFPIIALLLLVGVVLYVAAWVIDLGAYYRHQRELRRIYNPAPKYRKPMTAEEQRYAEMIRQATMGTFPQSYYNQFIAPLRNLSDRIEAFDPAKEQV